MVWIITKYLLKGLKILFDRWNNAKSQKQCIDAIWENHNKVKWFCISPSNNQKLCSFRVFGNYKKPQGSFGNLDKPSWISEVALLFFLIFLRWLRLKKQVSAGVTTDARMLVATYANMWNELQLTPNRSLQPTRASIIMISQSGGGITQPPEVLSRIRHRSWCPRISQ